MRSRFYMVLAALIVIPAAAHAQSTEIARAAELVDEGKIEEAIALLRKAVSTYSGEPAALVRYELGRSDTDPAAAAMELGRAAIQSSSRRVSALLALGELMIVQGNGAEAHDHLREAAATKMGALSERASYLRGVALHQAGRYADARNAFADYLVDYLEGAFQVSARIGIALSNEALGERRLAVEIYKAVTLQHRAFDEEPCLLSRLAELMMKDA
ncbi:MAG: tetratricopeptide repeat protein, partial [Candidatus Hydrogenedentota bacterium]